MIKSSPSGAKNPMDLKGIHTGWITLQWRVDD
jgi:hypothetical protein